jgi:hypothetical protein
MTYEQTVRQYNHNGNGPVSTRYPFSRKLSFISSAGFHGRVVKPIIWKPEDVKITKGEILTMGLVDG